MDLNSLWFGIIAFLFVGYFILEGFDFGVGILLPFIGKNDTERRMMINAIGPHWDGNEVWLITAGGALFAAFPNWYATLFSGLYLALFVMLLALIVRGVAFEFRSKDSNPLWVKTWDWAIFIGSLLPSILWGVAFANFIRGVPIDGNMQFTGNFWSLISFYSILGGITSMLCFALQGALFLQLKTENPIQDKAQSLSVKVWFFTLAALIVMVLNTYFISGIPAKLGSTFNIVPLLAVIALAGAGWFIFNKKPTQAFIFNSLTILFSTVSIFTYLYPRVLISSTDINLSLTIYNSASGSYTLTTMSWIALIFVPIMLAYQFWSYRIFKKKIAPDPQSLHY